METLAYYATASAAGIAGGWAFALIWARLVPSSLQGQFWSTMTGIAKSMLAAEHSRQFLDLYRRLGGSLARYLARNIGGLALGCVPLIALTIVLSVGVFGPWDIKAGAPSVYPHRAATLYQQQHGSPLLLDMGDSGAPIVVKRDAPVRAAVCWSVLRCLLLESLYFSVTVRDAPNGADYGAVIVRSGAASWNPLFPYLNDLEFMFFAMTTVGVVAAAVFMRRKRT